MLGLSAFLHRLRHVPPLQTVGRRPARVLRTGPSADAVVGRRDPGVLGVRPGDDDGAVARRNGRPNHGTIADVRLEGRAADSAERRWGSSVRRGRACAGCRAARGRSAPGDRPAASTRRAALESLGRPGGLKPPDRRARQRRRHRPPGSAPPTAGRDSVGARIGATGRRARHRRRPPGENAGRHQGAGVGAGVGSGVGGRVGSGVGAGVGLGVGVGSGVGLGVGVGVGVGLGVGVGVGLGVGSGPIDTT